MYCGSSTSIAVYQLAKKRCYRSVFVFFRFPRALERALLEALQVFHIDNESIELDKHILKRFNQWPSLKAAAQCNILSLVEKNFFTLENLKITDRVGELKKQIEIIKVKLNSKIFYHCHHMSENGLTCVKVIIPNMEEFHRVRYGNFVFPGQRGKQILR